jgi:plastocyanin
VRALAAALLVGLVMAATAHADDQVVSMGESSFSPSQLDLLVGDTVLWRNASLREHNVLSEAAGFESGRIEPRLGFSHTFATAGTYPYLCTIHFGMTGQVDVHPLLLSGPPGAVLRGAPVVLRVRAPTDVPEATIEEDAGAGFRPVATATEAPGGPGALEATVSPGATAVYRAVAGDRVSPSLRLEVTDQVRFKVGASARRGGATVRVRTLPAQPRARVVLQLYLRERFGWWPVASRRLDARSRARFLPRRRLPVRARVLLVGPDSTTVLVTSRPITLRPGR